MYTAQEPLILCFPLGLDFLAYSYVICALVLTVYLVAFVFVPLQKNVAYLLSLLLEFVPKTRGFMPKTRV